MGHINIILIKGVVSVIGGGSSINVNTQSVFGTYPSVRSVLIPGGWNRGVSLIQRCPHFRMLDRGVPLYIEVSSFQGVGIEGFH